MSQLSFQATRPTSGIQFGQNAAANKLNPDMPALQEIREALGDGTLEPGKDYILEDYKVPEIPMKVYHNNVVGFTLTFPAPLELSGKVKEETRVNVKTGEILNSSRAVGLEGTKATLEDALTPA